MKRKGLLQKVMTATALGLTAALCMTGCGSKTDTGSKEFSYWCAIDNNARTSLTNYGDMEMYQKAAEQVGVKLEFIHPAVGQEGEQFNLKIASNSLYDIMEYSWGSYAGGAEQAISDGLILELNPYIEKGLAPNLKKMIDENEEVAKQMKTDTGKYYAFPPIGLDTITVSTGWLIRGDWLEELNLDPPETIAEWENVLRQFKNKKGAVAPLTGRAATAISQSSLSGAFGSGSEFYLENNQVKYGPLEDGYKQYIDTMRKWYAEGLIDQDIFGNDAKTVQSNMANGKSGVFSGGIGGDMGTVTNAARTNNPDFKLQAIQFPVLNKGDVPQFANRAWEVRTSGMAAITSKCKNPELAVKFLDFFYGEEGSLMKNFGVEGKTYTMVDGNPVYTDEILKNPDGLSVAQALGKYTRASTPSPGFIDKRYHEQYYQLPEQQEAMRLWNLYADEALKTTLPQVTPLAEEAEELASIRSSVKTYVEEQATQFVMGLRSMSEWDSFVDTIRSMGIEKAVQIYQSAYDRYQDR